MSHDLQDIFNQSRLRCLADPSFVSKFYQCFLAISEENVQHFVQTEFETQERMLRTALMDFDNIEQMTKYGLDKWLALSRRHHELGITRQMYAPWLECMIQTVKQVDPECNEVVEEAWRVYLAQGIAIMRTVY